MLGYPVSFLFSLIFLVIATYTDLKERIVSNKITYSMVAAGIMLSIAFSMLSNNYNIALQAIGVTIATFAASYALWKIGVWAGGDVKLFTGIAALNQTSPNVLQAIGVSIPLFKSISLPIFPLTLFIFSIFSMMPVAIILTARKLLKQKNAQKKMFSAGSKILFNSIQWGLFLGGISYFIGLLKLDPALDAIAGIVTIIIFANIGKKIEKIAAALIFVIAAFFAPVQTCQIAAISGISILAFLLLIKSYGTAKKMLREEKKITELKEGEIVAETITEEEGKIKRVQPITLGRITELVKQGKSRELVELLKPKGRVIASHRQAGGLTEEEIRELRQLVKNKKLENNIMVKQSVPFVPAVLFAYCLLNVIGDLLWNIMPLRF